MKLHYILITIIISIITSGCTERVKPKPNSIYCSDAETHVKSMTKKQYRHCITRPTKYSKSKT